MHVYMCTYELDRRLAKSRNKQFMKLNLRIYTYVYMNACIYAHIYIC